MRYLKIVMLLLAVTVGTQACIIPVPIGGGDGGHHHQLRRRGARPSPGGERPTLWSPPRA
jgi:hypothetical protein